jgi:hypothetical protein
MINIGAILAMSLELMTIYIEQETMGVTLD